MEKEKAGIMVGIEDNATKAFVGVQLVFGSLEECRVLLDLIKHVMGSEEAFLQFAEVTKDNLEYFRDHYDELITKANTDVACEYPGTDAIITLSCWNADYSKYGEGS